MVYFDVIRALVDELMGPMLVDDWDITKGKFCRGFTIKGSRNIFFKLVGVNANYKNRRSKTTIFVGL